MGDRLEQIKLPYSHLAVVAHTPRELLFVDYCGVQPTIAYDQLRLNVFEREPVEVTTACLEAASLIIDSTVALRLRRELDDLQTDDEVQDAVRYGVIAGALERHKQARILVNWANTALKEEYTVQADMPEESDVTRRALRDEQNALAARTAQYVGHPALQAVIALKRFPDSGLPEAVRREAEMTMRVLYDNAGLEQQIHHNRVA